MRRRLVSVSTVALAFIALFTTPASAQRVLGVGDDALVLPRGVFRFRTLGQWTFFNERYGKDTPGRPDGALEPLAVDFNLDTVGIRQFPALATLQSGLRSLTGNPNWSATLGNTQVTLRDHVNAFPFIFEAGLSKRFSVGIQIPYVVTTASTFFNVNSSGFQGNLGFNPAAGGVATAITQNATFNTQFTTAANTLEGSLNACEANPAASPSCPALLAQRANARALIANSRAFAGGVTQIYGTSPFVPIAGTDAQLSIEARTAAFRALYTSFLGAGNPITTSGPFASQSRLTVRDAQRILSDSAFGIVAAPLATTRRSHVGDIDIGGKFSVYDSFGGSTPARMSPTGLNFRTAVGAVLRLPTGDIDSPDNFIDLGTGRGTAAIEGRWFGDVLLGPRFWQSFIVRFTKAFAPGFEVAPAYRKMGWHASDTHGLSFHDCRVPVDHLLGERGRGFANFLSALDDGRIAIAALALGTIQACLEHSVAYAKERNAFGKPIGSYQAVAFKCADLAVMAETARALVYQAAWRKDTGRPFKSQAAMAKLYATEAAVTATREATQIFGGYGFMDETPVARFYRDAKILEIGEGTSEVQRLVISRQLGLPVD